MTNSAYEKEVTEWLLQQNFYHGFLPRNDLIYILKAKGDYITRTTERPTPEGRRKDIVLSVCWPAEERSEMEMSDIKNIVIKKNAESCYLDVKLKFESMDALFRHYTANSIRVASNEMRLIRAVGLCSWEFKHSQITLNKKVGEGAYGEVYKGKVKRSDRKRVFDVAIKTMRADIDANDERMKEVMAEARLMRMLNHPNIVRIRGIAVLEQPLYIIIDFIDGGGLDSYLKRNSADITTDVKNRMSLAAAWGIEFIHSQDIIHRDIAARNCLYDPKTYVKLSDFGLSRKTSSYKVRQPRKMPTKWLAPESLKTFMFYRASDVYTYGILLYEIYTVSEPYHDMSGVVAKKEILAGNFPDFEKQSPAELYTMVKTMIYLLDHEKRATMIEIVKYLEVWLNIELVVEVDDSKFETEAETKEVPELTGDSLRVSKKKMEAVTTPLTPESKNNKGNNNKIADPILEDMLKKDDLTKEAFSEPSSSDGKKKAKTKDEDAPRAKTTIHDETKEIPTKMMSKETRETRETEKLVEVKSKEVASRPGKKKIDSNTPSPVLNLVDTAKSFKNVKVRQKGLKKQSSEETTKLPKHLMMAQSSRRTQKPDTEGSKKSMKVKKEKLKAMGTSVRGRSMRQRKKKQQQQTIPRTKSKTAEALVLANVPSDRLKIVEIDKRDKDELRPTEVLAKHVPNDEDESEKI